MAARKYMDARDSSSGWRLLAALLVALVTLGVGFALTLFLLRQLAAPWYRAHVADVRALFLVEAYLAILAGLLVAFGGRRGLAGRLGFRFTSLRDVGMALGLWLVALFAGTVITAALSPLLGPSQSNAVALLGLAHDPLFL